MTALPPETLNRRELHNAVHARPLLPLQAPSLVSALAVLHPPDLSAAAEHDHVVSALAAHDVRPEPDDPGFVQLLTDRFDARWERHGEFSVYTITQPMTDVPVQSPDDAPASLLPIVAGPDGWQATAPGNTFAAVQVLVMSVEAANATSVPPEVRSLVGPGRVLGSRIRETDAEVFTTYRLLADGTVRFVLRVGPSVTPARLGRVVAALIDIEVYRVLALRSFATARAVHPRLAGVENQLSELTSAMDSGEHNEEDLLHELLILAAEVQATATAANTEFSASQAYYDIVRSRLADLKITSVPGLTGVFTFLERRLNPAMATVAAAGRRLSAVEENTTRAADLLRTRVGISTERQNTALLAALQDGQRTQLRLQETVEGLSIAAISYYVVGLIGYLAKGLKAAGVPLNVDLVVAAAIPLVALGVWFALRRIKRRLGLH